MKNSLRSVSIVYIFVFLLSGIWYVMVTPLVFTAESRVAEATSSDAREVSPIGTKVPTSVFLNSGDQALSDTFTYPTREEYSTAGNPTDVMWINPAGGNWNVAANWQDGVGINRVPTVSDDVTISLSGTYTVTLNVAATVNTLTIG